MITPTIGNGLHALLNFVLVELINSLSSHSCRQQTVQFVSRIETSAAVTVVQVTEELYDLAWSLYQQRSDKDWGITDCSSFQVMGMLGLTQAFTNDQHFEQAGFELVRCSP